ncbi:lipid A biosynthesis lauroyl acyltransferase [Campylobacter pinnipediorum]|uniref:Lipid A biosynthesis acyltransferase n=1 Tax=Campylobacter pinnipediorum subsp. pinnipediorum TaxID=1660067 RepID=A0AAX0LBA1_9BACT|nr:lipid A biosynthesis lauroyl acyltransferase [Campylobacter pinnipediorum]AQW81738.1 lipid A biosynthesis lauroyl acyltransferase [Campylobacter pinnipediorum subsp. pinnipediorum]AQW83414.1 lipid A biosynthesis lauroyl acyltransferase [Campylobacter pinnipediorum subsp. pinnipediorum]OPA79786.1 lipid A biosynthesis acyltransferase [Campylobacter pinnipediorum subsp. pinnipediorum]OPA81609.1 lipid A biosynthesis acyltransferase [Campylobacter pinnipediorum subsp. pinnipediorum]
MDKVYIFGFYFLKTLIAITPSFIHDIFMKFIAFAYMKTNKKRFKVVMTNLDLAFEDSLTYEQKLNIANKVYINFANFLGINFIKNQDSTKEKILNRVVFKNENFLTEAIKDKRSIIIQSAHCGEWELIPLAIAAKFGKGSVIGRKLDSSAMQKILQKNRTQFNLELIDKKDGVKQILKSIKDGRMIGILVDQNTAKKEGIEVSFFNKRALHTPSASVIAEKTNSIIIPTLIHKLNENKNEICFFEPIDPNDYQNMKKHEAILQMTQKQADITEYFIRQNPDEYFWFHKRFKHFYEDRYEN